MTVSEAGRKGGQRTRERMGPDFYRKIGRMGGTRVKQLLEAGKRLEAAAAHEAAVIAETAAPVASTATAPVAEKERWQILELRGDGAVLTTVLEPSTRARAEQRLERYREFFPHRHYVLMDRATGLRGAS